MAGEFLYSLVSNQKKEHMKKENKEQTLLIAPAGEWQATLLSLLELMGYRFERPEEKEYSITIQSDESDTSLENLIRLVFTRASDGIPLLEKNSDQVTAAITGTDIFYEQDVEPDTKFSQQKLAPWMNRAFLGVFATPNAFESDSFMRNMRPSIDSQVKLRRALDRTVVYTSRIRRTREYLGLAPIPSADDPIEILTANGKLEGLWRLNPKNFANTDITVSGKTAEQNGLQFLNSIEQVEGLGLIKNSKRPLTDTELNALATLERKLLQLEARNQNRKKKVDLADVLEIGSMKVVFLEGYFNSPFVEYKYGRVSVPLVFDQYLQTLEQAQALVNSPSRVIRTKKPKESSWSRVIQEDVTPAVYQAINTALEAGGYLLLPDAFLKRLGYYQAPNTFVGVH
jgi:ATP phosphoribosyltransferase